MHQKKCQTANKGGNFRLTTQKNRVNVLRERNSSQRDSNGPTAHFSSELFSRSLSDILTIA